MSVYFVQSGTDGPIKIGYTCGKLTTRLWDLRFARRSETLSLIAVMPEAGREIEHALHKRFASTRLTGCREWFNPSPELLALCTEHSSTDPVVVDNARSFTMTKDKWRMAMQRAGISLRRMAIDLEIAESTIQRWPEHAVPGYAVLYALAMGSASEEVREAWRAEMATRPRSRPNSKLPRRIA